MLGALKVIEPPHETIISGRSREERNIAAGRRLGYELIHHCASSRTHTSGTDNVVGDARPTRRIEHRITGETVSRISQSRTQPAEISSAFGRRGDQSDRGSHLRAVPQLLVVAEEEQFV